MIVRGVRIAVSGETPWAELFFVPEGERRPTDSTAIVSAASGSLRTIRASLSNAATTAAPLLSRCGPSLL